MTLSLLSQRRLDLVKNEFISFQCYPKGFFKQSESEIEQRGHIITILSVDK